MNEFVEATIKSSLSGYLSLCGIILIFVFLEHVFISGKKKSISGNLLNLKIALVGTIFGEFFRGYITVWLSNVPGMGLIDLTSYSKLGMEHFILACAIVLLADDFCFYWMHRFQHKSTLLWQEHKLHHIDEQLNATSAARFHWLEPVVMWPLRTLPIAFLFKLDYLQGTAFALLSSAWIVFIHSNLRVNMGPFTTLITGPQVHRLHHSRMLEHRDRNFAAYFPIFDVLFGTYYRPERNEFPPTGVDGEMDVATLRESALLPFKGWSLIIKEWIRTRAN